MDAGAVPLERSFYRRDTAVVAQELLGKTIVRRQDQQVLTGRIVETEAYYGDKDPASRAYRGRKNYNSPMFDDPGRLFVYMVHSWWLLNIAAHELGEVGAVLIRALEPIEGIPVMEDNRGVTDLHNLTSGPGKLTKALNVTKDLHGLDVTEGSAELKIVDEGPEDFQTATSHRIGVTRDLPRKLRFYVKGNRFVSR
ncbi:DNA-3-methyladenine glycosylase [Candidatus Bathyarchaeota archaeon]|nr:DNA-3-methyladenine glycosylase [Candidatus Bathyarchaeota archaeon]